MLMVSTTGEHSGFYRLDEALRPVERRNAGGAASRPSSASGRTASRRLCTVLFMGGAGGSLRAGVTENPVRLTRSVKDALTRVTCGGAPAYVWPGGGITFMVDVTRLPANSFGYVPDAGARRADRVHDAAFRLRRARRTYGPRPPVEHAHRWGREACAPDRRATRGRSSRRSNG